MGAKKEGHSKHKEAKPRSFWWLKLIILLAVIGGIFYYVYAYQPEIWQMGEDFVNDMMEKDSGEVEELDIQSTNFEDITPTEEGIPEEYYGGHVSEGGTITLEEAEAKAREEFEIAAEDVMMYWPEQLPAGEWLWEADQVMGPVGKLSSDGWLFWVDKEFGGLYPHPTYYIVVYGDGYVDIFVGSFTPAVGDDSWVEDGTKAVLVQGSI